MKEITLAEAKKIEFEILSEIDRFCRSHGIRYQLSAGTLIGAVRHRGFIPWDDDIDIAMPREDYERFYKEFPKAHESGPYRLTSHRDKTNIYPFIKVIDDRTVAYEQFVDASYTTGIWVDVFPLDKLPEDDSLFVRCGRLQTIFGLVVANSDRATTKVRKALKKILTPVLRHIDIYALAEKMDRIASSAKDSKTSDVGIVLFGYGAKERVPDSIFETEDAPFEGGLFAIPKEYDTVLKAQYGDYMTLPPEEDRVAHGFDAFWKDHE